MRRRAVPKANSTAARSAQVFLTPRRAVPKANRDEARSAEAT